MYPHNTNILCVCLLFFSVIQAHLHIIEPTSRSKQTSTPNTLTLKNLYSDQYQHLLIEIKAEHDLFMLRALAPLKKAGKKITVKAPEYMFSVCSWCRYVDDVITHGKTDSDIHLPIEDIYEYYLSRETEDASDPFIVVDEEVSSMWHDIFIQDPNYKIGVCCQKLQPTRSPDIQTDAFYPLACMQDVSLYTFDALDKRNVPENIYLYAFSQETKRSLTHITAALDQLDLLITTQPHIAQIAGALGKTVWFVCIDGDTHDLEQFDSISFFSNADERNVVFDMMHHLAIHMQKPSAKIVTAEVATGELIDKMTILEIKTERIDDEVKLNNIRRELQALRHTFFKFIQPTPELTLLIRELKDANEALWETEDAIRDKEREKRFDNDFIHLARSVYIQNDERCRVKRRINELLGSRLIEEKSYKRYI